MERKKLSCLGAIVGHPPKYALYHTVQMVLVDPCDKLIICFLWILKGGKLSVTDMRELALPRHTCFIHPVNSFYNIPLYTEVK